jgi:hypothetical protein
VFTHSNVDLGDQFEKLSVEGKNTQTSDDSSARESQSSKKPKKKKKKIIGYKTSRWNQGYRYTTHQPEYFARKSDKRAARALIAAAGETVKSKLGEEAFFEIGELAAGLNELRDKNPIADPEELARALLAGCFPKLSRSMCIPPQVIDAAVRYVIKESDNLRLAEEDAAMWEDEGY